MKAEQRILLEENLLASCLASEAQCSKAAEKVESYHFGSITHQSLWKILLGELKRDGWDIGRIALHAKEDEDVYKAYLRAIADMDSCGDHSDWHTQELIDAFNAQNRAEELQRLLKGGNVTVEALEDVIKQYGTESSGVAEGPIDGKKALDDALVTIMDRVDKFATGESIGIKTGLDQWDEKCGGLFRKNVVTIAAPPGGGKTSFLMSVICNLALQKYKILVFSLEMDHEALMTRILVMLTGISMTKYMKGDLKEVDMKRMMACIPQAKEIVSNIYIDDTPGISPDYYSRIVRQHKDSHGLDVCMLDYLGRTGGDSRLMKNERIAEFSNITANESKRGDFSQVNFSQITRTGRAKDSPEMHDLAESASLENDSALIAFLSRPNEGDTNREGYEDAGINVSKNRHGPTGSFPARYYPRKMEWKAPIVAGDF